MRVCSQDNYSNADIHPINAAITRDIHVENLADTAACYGAVGAVFGVVRRPDE